MACTARARRARDRRSATRRPGRTGLRSTHSPAARRHAAARTHRVALDRALGIQLAVATVDRPAAGVVRRRPAHADARVPPAVFAGAPRRAATEALDRHAALGAALAHHTGVADHAPVGTGHPPPLVLRDGAAEAVSPHAGRPAAVLELGDADPCAADVDVDLVAEAPQLVVGVEVEEAADRSPGLRHFGERQISVDLVADAAGGVAHEARHRCSALGHLGEGQVSVDLVAEPLGGVAHEAVHRCFGLRHLGEGQVAVDLVLQRLEGVAEEALCGGHRLALVGGGDVLDAVLRDPELHVLRCVDLEAAVGVQADCRRSCFVAGSAATSAAAASATTAAASTACRSAVAHCAAWAAVTGGMPVFGVGDRGCHGEPPSGSSGGMGAAGVRPDDRQ